MNRIKELRKERGWKQEQLGEMLNVKRSAVSKYETGCVPLTDSTISLLCEIFGVSADYIIGRTEKRISNSEASFSKEVNSIIYSCLELSEQDLVKVIEYIDFIKTKRNS